MPTNYQKKENTPFIPYVRESLPITIIQTGLDTPILKA